MAQTIETAYVIVNRKTGVLVVESLRQNRNQVWLAFCEKILPVDYDQAMLNEFRRQMKKDGFICVKSVILTEEY